MTARKLPPDVPRCIEQPCENKQTVLGRCWGHHMRLPLEVRFWQKVDRSGDCWVWTAALDGKGYGKFRTPGRRHVQAHRFAYELLVGPIPEGLDLDHLCRVRPCVNPTHLEPVTHRVNVLRGTSISAQMAAQTVCVRGHDLTDPENLRVTTKGHRECIPCRRRHNAINDFKRGRRKTRPA